MEFNEIKAVVTGGASGLGLATVKEFLKHDASVAIFDLKSTNSEKVIRELEVRFKDKVIFVEVNVTDTQSVEKGLELTIDKFSSTKGVSIICGHFEGIDQRIIDLHDIEEISIGDYILSGGEIATIVFLDSLVRLLPDVLGNNNSKKIESFTDGLLEYPQYTKPNEFKGMKIPDILLSGNHKAIKEWQENQALSLTKLRRPDLIDKKKDKI